MTTREYKYIIVGGGLAGVSAIEGIREVDHESSVLLIGAETDMPYDRPPLTKKLWSNKTTIEKITLQPKEYYPKNRVELLLGTDVVKIDPAKHTVEDNQKQVFQYGKLLLATGSQPRKLDVPGADLPGILYFRTLADFRFAKAKAQPGAKAVVIGGGFIGTEMAAALQTQQMQVTLIFPESALGARIFPADLAQSLTDMYRAKGVRVLAQDKLLGFKQKNGNYLVATAQGHSVEADLVIIGAGVQAATSLAANTGLETNDGIVVNARLQTSHPDIYAAGDNTRFPYSALGQNMRIEHWDNAKAQGRVAGKNMAGAGMDYTYMPYFFSDLFEFGYEAVGEIRSDMEIFADWKKEYAEGVLYYLRLGSVRGVMLCNVWDKVEQARELIRQGSLAESRSLKGAIL